MQATVISKWANQIGLTIQKPKPLDLFSLAFWTPHPGAQSDFLQSPVDEVFFGGAAGPGKSDCLVISPLEQIHHSRYNGILFRRTYADLVKADGLIERSKLYYPHLGGQFNAQAKRWTFPSGAKIWFGAMEHEDDKLKFQSAQFQEIDFDELTHFTLSQFLYLYSRLRLPYEGADMRLKMRAASNPGGPGHDWVKNRYVTTDIIHQPRHFARINDEDVEVNATHPLGRSRLFIPAKHTDNPSLDKQYVGNLNQMSSLDRRRLLEGDWDALDTAMLVYDNWDNDGNISSKAEYNPDLPVYWSIDDGYIHPRVVLFIQVWPDDSVRIFDEYSKSGQLHEETIDECLEYPYNRPDHVTVDPSAAVLIALLTSPKYNLFAYGAYNDLGQGIKGVRREICDGRGVRSLIVHPRCKKLVAGFTRYRNDEKLKLPNGEPRPVKEEDDEVDSARYWIATHRMWNNG